MKLPTKEEFSDRCLSAMLSTMAVLIWISGAAIVIGLIWFLHELGLLWVPVAVVLIFIGGYIVNYKWDD